MKPLAQKVVDSGNDRVLFTDRGTSFGYNNLVVDMRGIPIMQEMGVPVVFDATHSVQLPGGCGDCSSGERQYVSTLAKAAMAAGAKALFLKSILSLTKRSATGRICFLLIWQKIFSKSVTIYFILSTDSDY